MCFAKSLTNKTKVLSLNSNVCYLTNFESWTAFNDPGNQLEWLEAKVAALGTQLRDTQESVTAQFAELHVRASEKSQVPNPRLTDVLTG